MALITPGDWDQRDRAEGRILSIGDYERSTARCEFQVHPRECGLQERPEDGVDQPFL